MVTMISSYNFKLRIDNLCFVSSISLRTGPMSGLSAERLLLCSITPKEGGSIWVFSVKVKFSVPLLCVYVCTVHSA